MLEGCPRDSTGWSPGGPDASISREIRSARFLLPYYRESFHRGARSTVVYLPPASLLGPAFSMVVSDQTGVLPGEPGVGERLGLTPPWVKDRRCLRPPCLLVPSLYLSD